VNNFPSYVEDIRGKKKSALPAVQCVFFTDEHKDEQEQAGQYDNKDVHIVSRIEGKRFDD
jgi:hypothetical protein